MSKAEASLGMRNEEFLTGLSGAKAALNDFKRDAAASFVGVVTFDGLAEGIRSVVDYGQKIQDLHERWAVGTTDLQQFGYAFQQNGLDIDDAAMAFNRLAVSRSKALQGDDAMIAAFKNLGVSLADLRTKSPDQLLLQIGAGSMHAAQMATVLGRNATQLTAVLRKLAEGSQELGQAMDEGTIKGLAEANTQLTKLQNLMTVAGGNFTAAVVMPIVKGWQTIATAGALGARDMVANWSHAISAADQLVFHLNPKAAKEQMDAAKQQSQASMDAFRAEMADIWKKDDPTHATAGGAVDDDETSTKAAKKEREGRQQESLQERLADIAEEAARKRLTIEQQIADLQAKQANDTMKMALSTGEARTRYESEIESDAQRIAELQEDAARQETESIRSQSEERVRAEEQYQRLKEENDKHEAEQILASTSDPAQQKALLDAAAVRQKALVDQMADELQDVEKNPVFSDGVAKVSKEGVEEMREALLDAKDTLDSIDSKRKELENTRRERPEQFRNTPFDALSSVGIRLAGVNYNFRGDDSTARKSLEKLTDTAYWVRKLYDKASQSAGTATFNSPTGT
jgi:hypothetical protein